jgi:hypothetical protein
MKKALSFDNAFIRVGVEGLHIPFTRRAMDESIPSLRSVSALFKQGHISKLNVL